MATTATTTTATAVSTQPPPAYTFSFTPFLANEYNFSLAPSLICPAFASNRCPSGGLGAACPQGAHRQPSNYNNLVCKHWLRGLCKKGTSCEFLHEYNLRSMPECSSFANSGACVNGNECLYRHVERFYRDAPCAWFERGFCPLGPHCAKRHVKVPRFCPYWMAGFCPDGAPGEGGRGNGCVRGGHPKWAEREELEKPEVRVILSEEEKERERERLAKLLDEEIEARERMYGGGAGDEGGDGRGRGRGRGGRGRARGRWGKKREF